MRLIYTIVALAGFAVALPADTSVERSSISVPKHVSRGRADAVKVAYFKARAEAIKVEEAETKKREAENAARALLSSAQNEATENANTRNDNTARAIQPDARAGPEVEAAKLITRHGKGGGNDNNGGGGGDNGDEQNRTTRAIHPQTEPKKEKRAKKIELWSRATQDDDKAARQARAAKATLAENNVKRAFKLVDMRDEPKVEAPRDVVDLAYLAERETVKELVQRKGKGGPGGGGGGSGGPETNRTARATRRSNQERATYNLVHADAEHV